MKKLQKTLKITSLRGFSRSNPVNKKSIFFTGSLRSLHSLAMTRKFVFQNYSGHLCTYAQNDDLCEHDLEEIENISEDDTESISEVEYANN